jgi:hypothetical protein
MAEVPEGAQLSEDGQWWWDGADWQPIAGDQVPDGGGEEGVPAFDFDNNGLRIDPENSPTPSADEPLKAAFAVFNTGTAGGECHVMFYVDDQEIELTWDSQWLEPGESATPDGDGYVPGIPGQTEGRHKFEAFANPPGQAGGLASNEIDIGAAE